MYAAKGVAVTDGLNRKNQFMPISTIINSYEKSFEIPMIVNLGHDRCKPVGYTMLNGIYFEPGKAYLTNISYLAEGKEDYEELQKLISLTDEKVFILDKKDDVDMLYKLLDGYISKDARVAPIGQAVAIIDNGIVTRIYPELSDKIQDGLIDFRELSPVYQKNEGEEKNDNNLFLIPGVYKRGDFLLFAHPYCRRNLSIANTINDAFFVELEKLRNQDVQIKIALDLNTIGLLGTESMEMEYQYWWGPKFDENLSNIPSGVTKYHNEHYDNLFSNITDTEFYWHEQDGIATFECEEICDKENAIEEEKKLFGCRYVHSMVNNDSGLPYHLDGAVRLYDDEQIIERLSKGNDISQCGKNTIYHKLWRIDGVITVQQWKSLITHYFRDNYLIGEYFGGIDEKFEQIKSDKKEKTEVLPQSKYIPVDFKPGDGIRMFYKIGNTVEIPDDRDAIVINHMMILCKDNKEKYLEADTLTFLKFIKSKGVNLRIPHSSMIDFNDMVFNYPCVACRNIQIANIVLESIVELCIVWMNRNDNRLLSFSFLINNTDKSYKVSFAGHVNDLVKILQNKPLKTNCVSEWVQDIYKEINNSFRTANRQPEISSLLNNDILWFERVFVDETVVKKYINKDKSLAVEIQLPLQEGKKLVDNNIITSPVYKIKESTCKKCNQNYRDCNCIKFIEDVSEEIVEADYLGMVWTTHSAYYPEDKFVLRNN